MAIFGPFLVPTGLVYVLQSTGVKGDIILAPINFNQTGIYTGTIAGSSGNSSLERFFLYMGG